MQSEIPIYEELVTDYGDPFARLPHDEAELEASIGRHPAGSRVKSEDGK